MNKPYPPLITKRILELKIKQSIAINKLTLSENTTEPNGELIQNTNVTTKPSVLSYINSTSETIYVNGTIDKSYGEDGYAFYNGFQMNFILKQKNR